MRVGLVGFGKTGKMVAEALLKERSISLEWVLRRTEQDVGTYAGLLLGSGQPVGQIYCAFTIDPSLFFKEHPVDVIIDFSAPQSVDIYAPAAEQGIRIVSAVSKYDQIHLERLRHFAQQTAVLYSPNITLGINFVLQAAKNLRRLVPQADVEIVEEHYREKAEISGTALRLAEALALDPDRYVSSLRVGSVVGRHEVVFGLNHETIRIVHESVDRAAFAEGALFAAQWLLDKPKGFYTMEEAIGLERADEEADALG